MRQKFKWTLSFVLVLTLVIGSSALALQSDSTTGSSDLNAMVAAEILKGDSITDAEAGITWGQGIYAVIKAMKLVETDKKYNPDQPASHLFPSIDDEAWYAKAFVHAYHHGFDIPADVDPEQVMNREQFAHYLNMALMETGPYALIKIYIVIEDEDEIEYMNAIQTLVILKIVQLDEERKFHPKAVMTLGSAAELLNNAIIFVEKHAESRITPPDPKPGEGISQRPPLQLPARDGATGLGRFIQDRAVAIPGKPELLPLPPAKPVLPDGEEIGLTIQAVNDEINKATLSWGPKPSSGYAITIDRIEFEGETAIFYYQLHYPDPDMMYLTVITEPQAEAYVAAGYEIVIRPSGFSGGGSSIRELPPVRILPEL